MNVSCPVARWFYGGIAYGSWRPRSAVSRAVTALAILVALSVACQAVELASWYGEENRGRLMANGQPFDPDKLTAASWDYDLGTKVVVTRGDRSVVVEITDRGPARRLFREGRKIDLSEAAFAKLADTDEGLIEVTIHQQ
ncbi:MAG TPA: septal ring lytic transglycosylase RlpA family protein [Verrucomicrobiae bacterium]|nr:septal ring lytic transglycosylase RlpA family protein [Verrucomicrobiae bacterium]